MMPNIKLKNRVYNERAKRLQKYFSPGVIELVRTGVNEGIFEYNLVEAIVNSNCRDSMSFNVVHDQVFLF